MYIIKIKRRVACIEIPNDDSLATHCGAISPSFGHGVRVRLYISWYDNKLAVHVVQRLGPHDPSMELIKSRAVTDTRFEGLAVKVDHQPYEYRPQYKHCGKIVPSELVASLYIPAHVSNDVMETCDLGIPYLGARAWVRNQVQR